MECRNNGFPGTDLWIPRAVPSVGVLCSRAWWEASPKTQGLSEDASRLHDLKRPSLFRRDEVPARNAHKIVRLRLHEPKKVFEGSKGRFYKNAPLAGGGTASHKERANLYGRVRLFRRDEVPARNTDRLSGFAFTHREKFLRVPRGVFSKTHPWQGVGQRPTKGERASPSGAPFQSGRSPFTKHPQTVRLGLHAPKKVFGGSKGRFFKNAPLAGEWGGVPHKKGRGSSSARLFYRFFSVNRQLSLHISKRPLSAVQPRSFLACSALA